MTTTHERVAREDLLTFVSACFACTGQREFYADSRGQGISIGFLHDYVLGNYRVLYARVLACGINDYNQAEIIFRLLASGRRVTPRSCCVPRPRPRSRARSERRHHLGRAAGRPRAHPPTAATSCWTALPTS